MSGEDDPLDGLPADLVRVLRDPSIVVPHDAAVFELIAKYANAPSDTVSGWGVDEWREAWLKEARRANRYKAALGKVSDLLDRPHATWEPEPPSWLVEAVDTLADALVIGTPPSTAPP